MEQPGVKPNCAERELTLLTQMELAGQWHEKVLCTHQLDRS